MLSRADVEQAHERLRQALLEQRERASAPSRRVAASRALMRPFAAATLARRAVACRDGCSLRRRASARTAADRARAGRRRPIGRRRAAPTPAARPARAGASLQTLAWAVAPTWVMDRCARRLGETFTLTFWPSGMQLVVISDPQAVKTLFTAPPEIAPSAAGNSPVRPVMGERSVIVLTGAEHMRQRKLLLPPFHGERMREYEQTIVRRDARRHGELAAAASRCACRSARARSRSR